MAKFDGVETNKPVALACYRSEDWPRIREISADRANLPEQYDEWLSRIARQLADLKASGIEPDKIIITPDALLAFAGEREINRQTRSEYAARQLANADGSRN